MSPKTVGLGTWHLQLDWPRRNRQALRRDKGRLEEDGAKRQLASVGSWIALGKALGILTKTHLQRLIWLLC